MKNRTIDNMVSVWDGNYMGINFIDGVEVYLYLLEGPKMIVINFDIDEDWKQHLDVVVPKKIMKTVLKMEDLFAIPCVIAVNYNDRQSWVRVMDVYMRLRDFFGKTMGKLTFEDDVYIPKDMFKLLIKAAPADVTA